MARRGGRVLVRTDKETQARNDTERKVATGKTWQARSVKVRFCEGWKGNAGKDAKDVDWRDRTRYGTE